MVRERLRLWVALSMATFFVTASSSLLFAVDGPQVIAFSPLGTAKNVRQVRASFSEDMVALGDPRGGASDPFDIRCPKGGHPHWADNRNWLYDFSDDLPGGVRCEFTLKAGLKALSGKLVVGTHDFIFNTGGPGIKTTRPYEGDEVEEEQAFYLELDAPADPATMLAHAYFSVTGVNEAIPVKFIEGDLREDIIDVVEGRKPRHRLADAGWRARVARMVRAARVRVATAAAGVISTPAEARPRGAVAVAAQNPYDARKIVIQAARPFPPGAKIGLVWGRGIATPGADGVENETDQTVSFEVRKNFRAEFNCERQNANAACIPFGNFTLTFTSDVTWGLAKGIRLRAANGKVWTPITRDGGDSQRDDSIGVRSVRFKGPFPEQSSFRIELPANFQDDSGRKLDNATRFPLEVATIAAPPLAKFPAEFGILESGTGRTGGEAVLPVTLRNLEPELKAKLLSVGQKPAEAFEGGVLRLTGNDFPRALAWLKKVNQQNSDWKARDRSILQNGGGDSLRPISIPKPNGPKPFEVVGIPLPQAGFYVVELQSEKLGRALLSPAKTMYVSTAALVTNLSVHLKRGRETSAVWVTTLDSAQPVAGAAVAVRDCTGKPVATAQTDAHGLAVFKGGFKDAKRDCAPANRGGDDEDSFSSDFNYGLFVTAEKGGDFSFVHSGWQKGIEAWRFNLPEAEMPSPNLASTVFDRTLLRAGETVHMKHFARRHTSQGFAPIPRGDLPKLVQIVHEGDDTKYELPLAWRDNDTAETTWEIPRAAKLGIYRVTLTPGGENPDADKVWESGSFRVEEYRVPLMKGQIQGPSGKLVAPTSIPVDLSVEYLSGGGASHLPVTVRYQQTRLATPEIAQFEGFDFGNGKARADDGNPPADGRIQPQKLVLDRAGMGHANLTGIAVDDRPQRVQVELEYRDPNGEIQTVAQSIPVYPAGVLAGIKPDSWFASRSSLKFQVAVVDLSGNPAANSPVEVRFLEQKTYSHRKRLIGGFYAYDNRSELIDRGVACAGSTDEHGLLDCDSKPPVSGNLILQASAKDSAGLASYAHSSTWVYDQDEWWFSQDDSDRIDVLAEKKRYEPGETATFQVRSPFREATALVTVEREGILDSYVMPIAGKKPLVQIPIKPNYGPNVYVSVLVVRGRVGDKAPTAIVDLGKPAYKLGIAGIQVGWKPYELKVQVTPSKEVFRPREKAHVRLTAVPAAGGSLPRGGEVVVAVVDEGLLQLKANDSWKLLDAMMSPRGYEVETSTAQSQVVGKRHFGLKAAPPGGDGGRAPARELFDTLLYWNARVALDANGQADVEFPLNDSITAFRIAGVASAGSALFGTGQATIRSNQDLAILSGISPIAREGDQLPVEFTVRNTTAARMSLVVSGKVSGVGSLPTQNVALAAGESRVVRWPVTVPSNVGSLQYEIDAKDDSGKYSDTIRITQRVAPAVPVRVLQATLSQVDGSLSIPVARPADALPNRGGVKLTFDPSLLSGLAGVRDYMRAYPYTCMEQRASRAISLNDRKLWDAAMGDLPSYLDANGLVKYFPSGSLGGSDVLTSYLLAVADESGWVIPADSRGKMIAGLVRFVEGKQKEPGALALPTVELAMRKLSAIDALSRYGSASFAMTGSFELNPNSWPTSGVIDWLNVLERLGDVPNRDVRRKQADQILRARLMFSGTRLGFSTESSDALVWMMIDADVNANRFVLAALKDPAWKADLGRLELGALSRQQKGHWSTTTANAWGTLAAQKFAAAVESEPVTGETLATLGNATQKVEWPAKTSPSVGFAWPDERAALEIRHHGTGMPWVTTQASAAIPLTAPLFAGYQVKKTVTGVSAANGRRPAVLPGGAVSAQALNFARGDVARIRLEVDAQSDMTWVALNDPIPAGAAILGRGLGGDPTQTPGGEGSGVAPSFDEKAQDGYRAYYEFVPKGKFTVEYTVRFNADGTMNLPPTRVEALYAPEVFGELPNEAVSVRQ